MNTNNIETKVNAWQPRELQEHLILSLSNAHTDKIGLEVHVYDVLIDQDKIGYVSLKHFPEQRLLMWHSYMPFEQASGLSRKGIGTLAGILALEEETKAYHIEDLSAYNVSSGDPESVFAERREHLRSMGIPKGNVPLGQYLNLCKAYARKKGFDY